MSARPLVDLGCQVHQGPPSATGGVVSSISLTVIRRSVNSCTRTRFTLSFSAYTIMWTTYGRMWKHWFSLPKIQQNFIWLVRRLYMLRSRNRLKNGQEELEKTLITNLYTDEGASTRASERHGVSFLISLVHRYSSVIYEDLIGEHQYLSGIVFPSRSLSVDERRTLRESKKDVSVGLQEIPQYLNSLLFSWDAGLGLLFWRRLIKGSSRTARESLQVYVSGKFPSLKEEQKEVILIHLAVKIRDLRKKFHIGPLLVGLIPGDVDYLLLPKRVDSNGVLLVTRKIYNGTSCSQHDNVILTPSVGWPSANRMCRGASSEIQLVLEDSNFCAEDSNREPHDLMDFVFRSRNLSPAVRRTLEEIEEDDSVGIRKFSIRRTISNFEQNLLSISRAVLMLVNKEPTNRSDFEGAPIEKPFRISNELFSVFLMLL